MGRNSGVVVGRGGGWLGRVGGIFWVVAMDFSVIVGSKRDNSYVEKY